jgi:Calx-beta domain-containing protein/Big-like domain-containing protein
MTNSTVSGNSSQGIYNASSNAVMRLTNCTVTANVGTGALNSGDPSSSARNSIIAGNTSTDVRGFWTSLGHNLIGNPGSGPPTSGGSSGFTNGANGDQVGTSGSPLNPQLGPLADNGGPTRTHALLSSSTALDAGDDCVAQASHCGDSNISQLTTDQRGPGFSRLVDGPDVDTTATVDIGAYEMQTPLANLPDTSTNEDTQLVVSFDGGDTSTITSVTVSSSNSTLVPNDTAHLSVTMTGSTGIVTINPAADLSGTTNITVTINRTGGPENDTFLLTVNPANDAPSFTKGSDQTVNEDAGAQTVVNWATSISAGPPDESGQTLAFQVTNNTNPSLFVAGPAISSTGTLTYTLAADPNGSATITINLKDDGGTANGGVDTSASQSFTITVNAVNDAPSFTKGADQMVNEDAGAQSVVGWATAISRGPADESAQTLTFQVTGNTNAALFSTGPAISSTGTLTYTPTANANGSATITINLKDNGGTANGGVDTSASQTFNITVNPVNDAPSFTKGANQTVNEDAAAQTVNNWATAISAGPADESGQVLTFQVTGNTNAALFSAGPAISSTGTLTYTPAANANGSATITINLKDDGGTANGGVDTSALQTFTITVNAVNDAPSFTNGADQTVNENAGAQTVAGWATSLSRGPSDEAGQTLTFQVTNNTNAALFSAGPAISSTGTLTYTPAANANGSATITINLKDSGGTANGGVDTSVSQTVNITVNAVNDAPSFTKGANQTVNEDAGAQTVNNWATAISAGPANESSQAISFTVTNNTNAGLFSAGPAVSSTGTLTYTPAADANGSATITIVVQDNGGTANGGVDTSVAQTFTITLNSVNDVPSFTKGADQTANNNAGAQTVANWATAISAGAANESGQTLTFQVTNNTNTSLFSAGPAISSAGTLTYTPAANTGGTATVTVNLRDDGGTANGGVDTSPSQSFTITVTPVGGFINFSAATYNTTESSGFATVTVKRTGDLTGAATVDYASSGDNGLPCSTANGVATPKCDFTTALGTLSFAVGEDTKTVNILISQDGFVEGPETFSVSLSNQTGNSALGAISTSSTTIADDLAEPPTNVIDDVRNFVRQHYHDFLSREPDTSGWDFWTNQITSCGSDVPCNEVRSIDVSASFFLSIEFQQSGYLVERFYKVGYGDATGTSNFQFNHQLPVPIVRFNEFLKDTQRIGQGVIVLAPGWEQALESNKQAYALEFVQTSRFTTALPTTLTPDQFVDRLNQNAGDVLSLSERTTAINLFGGAANTSNVTARAQAVRQVADDSDLFSAEYNRAFVLAEYFGYLRRNPNDAPETTLDYTGYDFWLTKLNQFNGNYINAEMVKAFLSSIEYRQRFGP